MMMLPLKQARVLALIARGKSNKEIAYEMNITENTVKVHVRNLCSKLRCSNRVKLALTYHNIDWRV